MEGRYGSMVGEVGLNGGQYGGYTGVRLRIDAGVKVGWRVDPPQKHCFLKEGSSPSALGTPGAVQDGPSVLR